jgi:hypothetical protein
MGFSEAAEKILALAPYRDHLDFWRSDDICQRVRDRAVHLHVVLDRNAAMKMERGAE